LMVPVLTIYIYIYIYIYIFQKSNGYSVGGGTVAGKIRHLDAWILLLSILDPPRANDPPRATGAEIVAATNPDECEALVQRAARWSTVLAKGAGSGEVRGAHADAIAAVRRERLDIDTALAVARRPKGEQRRPTVAADVERARRRCTEALNRARAGKEGFKKVRMFLELAMPTTDDLPEKKFRPFRVYPTHTHTHTYTHTISHSHPKYVHPRQIVPEDLKPLSYAVLVNQFAELGRATGFAEDLLHARELDLRPDTAPLTDEKIKTIGKLVRLDQHCSSAAGATEEKFVCFCFFCVFFVWFFFFFFLVFFFRCNTLPAKTATPVAIRSFNRSPIQTFIHTSPS
jgi:hypothetical protein